MMLKKIFGHSLATTVSILLCLQTAICVEYQTSQEHGDCKEGETTYDVTCPFGSALTGIQGAKGKRDPNQTAMERLAFICSNNDTKYIIGPYGVQRNTELETVQCPPGECVSAFTGGTYSKTDMYITDGTPPPAFPYVLTNVGIRCRPCKDMQSQGKTVGESYIRFDDGPLSKGFRPYIFTVCVTDRVIAVKTTFISTPLTFDACKTCKNATEEWAPNRGGMSGKCYNLICEAGGSITGILRQTSSVNVCSVGIKCTSSLGVTTHGPYGKDCKNTNEDCPDGSFVSSLHGVTTSDNLLSLGIRCANIGQLPGPKRTAAGGDRGTGFDENSLTKDGKRRPVQVNVCVNSKGIGLQVKYSTLSVTLNCTVVRLEITDTDLGATFEGMEVIGMVSGYNCAKDIRKLGISMSQRSAESTTVETTDSGEFKWGTELKLTAETGVKFIVEATLTAESTTTFEGSKQWSKTTSTTNAKEQQQGESATFEYTGPGALLGYGYAKKYKVNKDNVPIVYHFQCSAGTLSPQPGTIKLASTYFSHATFADITHKFASEAACNKNAKRCLDLVDGGKVLDKDFKKNIEDCFAKK